MSTSTTTFSSSSPAPAPSSTTPDLPPISTLSNAPIKTQLAALDLLFEPSTELHTLALPALKPKRVLANPGLSADLPPPPPLSSSSSSSRVATVPEPPFTSYASLIQHIGTLLTALAQRSEEDPAARQKLHGVLGSHPRLGARKVESAQSQAEQASLSGGSTTEAEAEAEAGKLKALNEEYEARFPGLRYVVFVNGRSRAVVMEDMRRRIDRGDAGEEEREAVTAMVDIALDRARKLEAASGL